MKNNYIAKLFLISLLLTKIIYVYAMPTEIPNRENAIRDEIFADINDYRSSKNLKPLEMNQFISEVAKRHSQSMANGSATLGHQGFNSRMARVFQHFKGAHAIAENVAFTDFGSRTVVQSWLNSSGHRKNIEGNYHLTGIGSARDKNGRIYITQIFIST